MPKSTREPGKCIGQVQARLTCTATKASLGRSSSDLESQATALGLTPSPQRVTSMLKQGMLCSEIHVSHSCLEHLGQVKIAPRLLQCLLCMFCLSSRRKNTSEVFSQVIPSCSSFTFAGTYCKTNSIYATFILALFFHTNT